MRRRRPSDSDSLELLLDTICNTFGGVLFVALLIVILVRMSGHAMSTVSPQSSERDSADTLETTIARRKAELKSLQSALSEHRANLRDLEAEDAFKRAQQLIAVRRRVDDLADQRMKHVSELDAKAKSSEKLQSKLAHTAAEVAKLKEVQVRLESQLRHERQVRSRTARLPILHSTSKSELPAILRFGRLFFPYKTLDDLRDRNLNPDDFIILRETDSYTSVTPKPFAGIEVGAGQSSQKLIDDALAPLDKDSSYLAIAVWEDSFGQFAALKDTLVRRGIEYRLVPVTNDGIIQEADIKESLVQ
jgi:hypothetical protein